MKIHNITIQVPAKARHFNVVTVRQERMPKVTPSIKRMNRFEPIITTLRAKGLTQAETASAITAMFPPKKGMKHVATQVNISEWEKFQSKMKQIIKLS